MQGLSDECPEGVDPECWAHYLSVTESCPKCGVVKDHGGHIKMVDPVTNLGVSGAYRRRLTELKRLVSMCKDCWAPLNEANKQAKKATRRQSAIAKTSFTDIGEKNYLDWSDDALDRLVSTFNANAKSTYTAEEIVEKIQGYRAILGK